ncbi:MULTISPECIES: CPCC family cysteine-rich protein [unclassified Streptomyces]|uniref:CPCC family cysteine-rich protein n=1 Tax=unclassified Streptomyces TaxID=2593676 RepID=UPI00382DA306
MDTRRPCPCCGHLVLVLDAGDGWPGTYVVCPVCHWEDDPERLRWPYRRGAAHRAPLAEAQRNVGAYGACDQYGRRFARPPADDEPLDPDWRPIDPAVDLFEEWTGGAHRPWPEDRTVLCWWLPSFWGRPEEPEPQALPRVVIDVGAVRGDRDLHAVLKRELGFPSFYGMNRAAFWDAITGLVPMPAELCFTGWAGLERRVPESAAALRGELAGYAAAAPGFTVVYDA